MLNGQGSRQRRDFCHAIDAAMDVATQQQIVHAALPPSIHRPTSYIDPRSKEPCRYIVFGLPFSETLRTASDTDDPWNPRPIDVVQVLLTHARQRLGPITMNGPGWTQDPMLRERLHALERGWEMDPVRSLALLERERKIDPLYLLAVSRPLNLSPRSQFTSTTAFLQYVTRAAYFNGIHACARVGSQVYDRSEMGSGERPGTDEDME